MRLTDADLLLLIQSLFKMPATLAVMALLGRLEGERSRRARGELTT